MKGKLICLVMASSLIVLTGCATASKSYTWQDINKTVTPNDNEVPMAYLKVYAEIKSQNSDGYEYERGIPCTIYTPEGRKVRSVEDRGFTPDLIALPPGKYVVAPTGWENKKEIFGVVLEKGKFTEVHFRGTADG